MKSYTNILFYIGLYKKSFPKVLRYTMENKEQECNKSILQRDNK